MNMCFYCNTCHTDTCTAWTPAVKNTCSVNFIRKVNNGNLFFKKPRAMAIKSRNYTWHKTKRTFNTLSHRRQRLSLHACDEVWFCRAWVKHWCYCRPRLLYSHLQIICIFRMPTSGVDIPSHNSPEILCILDVGGLRRPYKRRDRVAWEPIISSIGVMNGTVVYLIEPTISLIKHLSRDR